MEAEFQELFRTRPMGAANFRESMLMIDPNNEDFMKARDAWLADGSPSDLRYEFDSNGILHIKPV